MPTTKAKREKSPEMPALERIVINNSTRINNEQQQATSDDKLSGVVNNNKNNKTDNNNNNNNNNKTGGSTSDKVIGIFDLGKPSSTTKQRLNALLNNQVKYLEAESKYHEELHKLQSKYARVYTEIFEKRKEIVSGEREPNTDECQWPPKKVSESKNNESNKDEAAKNSSPEKPSSSSSEEEEERRRELSSSKNNKNDDDDDDDEKGVANFWLEVLQSSAMISDLILDHDEPVLSYLQDVRVRYDEDKPASSYTLEFHFAENPYFRNRVLTKTFEFKNKMNPEEPLKYRGPDLMRTIGSTIDWKPKKNVTIKLIKKKIKSRNRKAPPKIITKEEEQESFFCFFESHSMDDDDLEKKKKEIDESKKSTAKDADNADKQVAIRNKKSTNHRSESDESNNGDEMNDDAAELRRFLAGPICLMRDFTLAERMRTKLIPRAVLYMTGEIEESDSDDDEDEDDDEDDYYDSGDFSDEDVITTDDDDDDDEDNDSDDDREGRAWSKRPACTRVVRTSGNGGRGGNFGPEECKQS